MEKSAFLDLMNFPPEWERWGMVPDELWKGMEEGYEPGDERASEHDRNGAFHWWLRRVPDKDSLRRLLHLSFLDPDQLMAADVRLHIARAANFDSELQRELETLGCSGERR